MNHLGPWYEVAAPENKYQYNGKELNEELGLDWLDYGARWYDASIGRFSSTDRFAEKYYPMTPYQYGANNPIKYIDINGDSLRLNFIGDNKSESLIGLMGIISNALEGQYQGKLSNISYDEESGSYSGLLEIVPTKGGGNFEKMSLHGQEFYREITEIAHEKGTLTEVNVDYARIDVATGNFALSTIDIADIQQFNTNLSELGGTQGGKIIHEFREQYSLQVLNNKDFPSAHRAAIQAENNVNLSVRRDHPDDVQAYSMGGRTVRNRIIWENRRIIQVQKR
jgi:RHS repeat-associated protein